MNPANEPLRATRTIRVMLVDDHAMVRTGLQAFIGSAADMEVVGIATNGREAVDLGRELLPDVILMDLMMPVMGGLDAIRELRAGASPSKIIALSTSEESKHVAGALDAGADGYLVKDVEPAVLMAGIRSVLDGGVPISPSIAASLLGRGPSTTAGSIDTPNLTPRETAVLRLISQGRTNRQIGTELGIAEKTVKTHCSHLFQRIGVADRSQAAAWAARHLASLDPSEAASG
jgi:DNA-binding NarL/FixJ family response regulator